MREAERIVAAQGPVIAGIAHLTVDERITLLAGVMCQEICNLPPRERDAEFACVIRQLPEIMDATEQGMREALAENARHD